MPIKKTYAQHGDACATAHGIELIGDVWTYPVLRELFLGPKRFSELAALLHGITPAVLTARLRDLEAKGIVQRIDAAPPVGPRYRLTRWGHELEAPLEGIAAWAQASPTRDASGGLTPDAAVLAMQAMARGCASPREDHELQLTLFDSRCERTQDYGYTVRWDQGGLTVARESAPTDGADLRCDSTAWTHRLFDDNPSAPRGEPALPARVEAFVAAYRGALGLESG